DAEVAARHQEGEWEVQEDVIPVQTLTDILSCYPIPQIHFLKIDVEGTEAEVLAGLDLARFRPWIIIVEATQPLSMQPTRNSFEHLIIQHRYEFAYFDALNCFYVANEVGELKERLRTPPNIFDDFIKFREWSNNQKAALLEAELGGARGHAEGLE